MKKSVLIILVAVFAFDATSQNRIHIPANIKNQLIKKPYRIQKEYDVQQNQTSQIPVPYLSPSKSLVVSYEEIGSTLYDLQTNSSVDPRMHLYADGTIGTTWTKGDLTSYADRGTGYQYFDGSVWINPLPSVRLETVKTGWPSYSHLGTNGEIVISHVFGTGLLMLTRPVKGTGTWTQSNIPASTIADPGIPDPSWPRICTQGNIIHVLSASNNAWGGQTFPVWYSRSQDAGATWDILNVTPTQLDSAAGYTEGFGGDVYDWAEPNGGAIAYLIGDNWTDLVMMKSLDNGTTWTKTVIFQHPYPDFQEAHDLTVLPDGVTPDTPYVCDGAHAIALDANGVAHIAFGIMRVLNSDTTDASTSYFPATDGLAFWREGDPMFTDLNPDNVYAAGRLIAWVQERNGTPPVFDNYVSTNTFASYYTSLSGMPQLVLGDAGEVYCIYTSTCEDAVNASGEYFNHIWGTRSLDHGYAWTWGDQVEITSDFDLMECVFPATSQTSDNRIHFACQVDNEPGLSVRGDEDPAATNSIIYFNLEKSDLTKVNYTSLTSQVNVFPNPLTSDMNVAFSFNKSTYVNMTIVNLMGSTVMSQQFVTEKGETKKIDVSKLSTGIYLARFETDDGTFTQKIMKE